MKVEYLREITLKLSLDEAERLKTLVKDFLESRPMTCINHPRELCHAIFDALDDASIDIKK